MVERKRERVRQMKSSSCIQSRDHMSESSRFPVRDQSSYCCCCFVQLGRWSTWPAWTEPKKRRRQSVQEWNGWIEKKVSLWSELHHDRYIEYRQQCTLCDCLIYSWEVSLLLNLTGLPSPVQCYTVIWRQNVLDSPMWADLNSEHPQLTFMATVCLEDNEEEIEY